MCLQIAVDKGLFIFYRSKREHFAGRDPARQQVGRSKIAGHDILAYAADDLEVIRQDTGKEAENVLSAGDLVKRVQEQDGFFARQYFQIALDLGLQFAQLERRRDPELSEDAVKYAQHAGRVGPAAAAAKKDSPATLLPELSCERAEQRRLSAAGRGVQDHDIPVRALQILIQCLQRFRLFNVSLCHALFKKESRFFLRRLVDLPGPFRVFLKDRLLQAVDDDFFQRRLSHPEIGQSPPAFFLVHSAQLRGREIRIPVGLIVTQKVRLFLQLLAEELQVFICRLNGGALTRIFSLFCLRPVGVDPLLGVTELIGKMVIPQENKGVFGRDHAARLVLHQADQRLE